MAKGTAAQRCKCEGEMGGISLLFVLSPFSLLCHPLVVKSFTKVSLPALPSHGGQEIKETLNGKAELGGKGC